MVDASKFKTSGDDKVTAKSDQKFSVPHYLFAIEPDVEVAADTIDVGFRNPVLAGVFGVGMTKCDVNAWNFFVLQNIADHMGAGGVRPNREFADAIAVFIRACIGTEFFEQFLVFTLQGPNSIILHFDFERSFLEVAILLAEVIAHNSIHHEDAL